MKIGFLDAATMGDTPMTEIEKLGEFICYPDCDRQQSFERCTDCEVAIVNKVRVDDEFLDHAPALKLVCEAGTGINNIDTEACAKRNVIVRNVANYSTDSVAQCAFMHILNLMGNAFYYDNFVKSGVYSQGKIHTDPSNPFIESTGKVLGIVGMGAIGQKVASIGKAFGMEVIYYSTSGTSHCTDYPSVSLEELLTRSDAISIHAPYNERTAGLIGYEQFRMMKKSAVLVNTGRGGIEVEADLARALDENLIKGAAIDVFVKEPLPLDSPLMHLKDMNRIIFSPHIAWTTHEARQRLADEMARNIRMGW